MLIPNASERAARNAEKRRLVLRFLRQHIYSDVATLGLLLGLRARQPVERMLTAMAADDLLKKTVVVTPSERQVTLWGITPHGQAMAWDVGQEEPEERYFEPGRCGLSILQHTLDLQRLQIVAQQAGCQNWELGDRASRVASGLGRPDALCTNPSGKVWAIECERSIKTTKRYVQTLADRLQQAKRGSFERIVWVSPSEHLSKRVEGLINSIDSVPIAGRKIQLEDRHRELMTFAPYSAFPECIL